MTAPRRTFERTLLARSRAVCLASSRFEPPSWLALVVWFFWPVVWRVCLLTVCALIIGVALLGLLLLHCPIMLALEAGAPPLAGTSLWQFACTAAGLAVISVYLSGNRSQFVDNYQTKFFLPLSDDELFRRWLAHQWFRAALLTLVIGGITYSLVIVYLGVSLGQVLLALGLLLVQTQVVPSLAVVIDRCLPRWIPLDWGQYAAVPLVMVGGMIVLIHMTGATPAPGLGEKMLAILPTGWTSLVFQGVLIEQRPLAWLWLLPAIGLILVARRWARVPLQLQEFQFKSAVELVPVGAPGSPWQFQRELEHSHAEVRQRPAVRPQSAPATHDEAPQTRAARLRGSMALPEMSSMPGIVRVFSRLLNPRERLLLRTWLGPSTLVVRFWWALLAGYAAVLALLLIPWQDPTDARLGTGILFTGIFTQVGAMIIALLMTQRAAWEHPQRGKLLEVSDLLPIGLREIAAIQTKAVLGMVLLVIPLTLGIPLLCAWTSGDPFATAAVLGLKLGWIAVCLAPVVGAIRTIGRLRPFRQFLARHLVELVAAIAGGWLGVLAITSDGWVALGSLAAIFLLCLAIRWFEQYLLQHWEFDLLA